MTCLKLLARKAVRHLPFRPVRTAPRRFSNAVWADEFAAKHPRLRVRPSPTRSVKMLAIARAKVADRAKGEQLVDQFAAELARWAQRRCAIRMMAGRDPVGR